MQTDAFAIREDRRARYLFARWAMWIVVGTLLLWMLSGENAGRYILYALPPLLIIVHLVLNRFRSPLDGAGLTALALYSLAVLASLAVNPSLGFYTQRDLLIIFGYILVFNLHMEAPPVTADVVLLGLVGGLLIEAQRQGVSFVVDFSGSRGILESDLAFPLGVVLIYHMNERRWGRALVTAVVFIIAFKRIAMVGVLAAVALDFLAHRLSQAASRRVFAAAVVLACLIALFSTMIFGELGTLAGGLSSNAVSLGRYSFAEALWAHWSQGGMAHWLFGFGPGAADAWLAHKDMLANPHNDWLKILVDYGAFGMLLLSGVLAVLFPRTRLGNMLYLYAAILMITDNTLIYLFHFAIVFLISRIPPTAKAGHPARRSWPAFSHQAL
jgi:hypothetical protein